MSIDKRFALIGKDGDVMFPYMKTEKRRNLYGFALSEPGKRDALGMGIYTKDISDVISKVVNHQWSVRVKSSKRPGNSLGLNKNEIVGYWISPELTYLISNSKTQPLTNVTFKSLTGKALPDELLHLEQIPSSKTITNRRSFSSEVINTELALEEQDKVEGSSEAQGYEPDPLVRKAIEMYAVSIAREFYEAKGYTVQEVGKPYDLSCTKNDEILHVEVKGSKNELEQIILTTNEIAHARDTNVRTDLFVVDCIELHTENRSQIKTSAGRVRLKTDWIPAESELKPIQFKYRLPLMTSVS